jgi:hypothetical protein
MLDHFYLTVGCMVLLVFWAFVKACEKLEENKNAQHHCRNDLSRDGIAKCNVAFSL